MTDQPKTAAEALAALQCAHGDIIAWRGDFDIARRDIELRGKDVLRSLTIAVAGMIDVAARLAQFEALAKEAAEIAQLHGDSMYVYHSAKHDICTALAALAKPEGA